MDPAYPDQEACSLVEVEAQLNSTWTSYAAVAGDKLAGGAGGRDFGGGRTEVDPR